jgi:tetratricopeptide (TPR) repeat protein
MKKFLSICFIVMVSTSIVSCTQKQKGPSIAIDETKPPAEIAAQYADVSYYTEAIDYYQKALETDKDNIKIHLALANVYLDKYDAILAVNEADKVLAIEPDNQEALIIQAEGLLRQEKIDYALDKLDKARRINPQSADLYRVYGYYYTAKEDKNQAMENFRKSITYDSTNPENNAALAYAYLKMDKNFQQSLRYYQMAHTLKPNKPEYVAGLCLGQGINGDFKSAYLNCDKAIKMNPDLGLPYLYMGLLYYAEGNREKSKENLTKAKQLTPFFAKYVDEMLAAI